jgi:hypothetical protein
MQTHLFLSHEGPLTQSLSPAGRGGGEGDGGNPSPSGEVLFAIGSLALSLLPP